MYKGDTAPLDVQLINEKGEKDCLRNHLGKYMVVYFFPKHGAPGSVKESQTYRNNRSKFDDLRAEVIGVSKEPFFIHKQFKDNFGIDHSFWSDYRLQLTRMMGTGGPRTVFGNKVYGESRSTYLIGPDGRVINTWFNSEPGQIPTEVVSYLRKVVNNLM